jgi:hypothetical protein
MTAHKTNLNTVLHNRKAIHFYSSFVNTCMKLSLNKLIYNVLLLIIVINSLLHKRRVHELSDGYVNWLF